MKQGTLDGASESLEEKALSLVESNEQPPKITLHWSLIVANAIMLMFFTAIIFGFGRYLFRVLLPEMRADIGFDYATAGILSGMMLVGYLPVAFLAGWLRDNLGAARLILWGCFVCTFCLLALNQVSSVWQLGLLLALMGACNAAMWSPLVEVVGRFIPKQHEVKVLGLITSGSNLGILVNGLLVPFFLARSGWQPIWLVVGLMSAAITVVGFLLMSITGVLKADHQAAKVTSKSNATGGMSRRLRLIERHFFLLAAFYALISFFGTTLTTYLSAYMRDELALSTALVGQTWSMIGMAGLVSGFVMGWLGDRIGIKGTMQITILLGITATLLILHHALPVEFIMAGALIAFGFFPLYALVAAYVAKYAPPEQSTFIFGLLNVVQALASIVGAYLGGLLQTWTGTFFWSYILVLCGACAALAISSLLPDRKAMA